MDPSVQQETRALKENLGKMVSLEFKDGREGGEDPEGREKRERWDHLVSLESQEAMVCQEDLDCQAPLVQLESLGTTV